MKKVCWLTVVSATLMALNLAGVAALPPEVLLPPTPVGGHRGVTAPLFGTLDLRGCQPHLAAVLNIGRSNSYGKSPLRRTLTDFELLAKEKRIEQREKRKEDSKLYRALYSFCGFFLAPEYIDYSEERRLKALHANKKTSNALPSAQNADYAIIVESLAYAVGVILPALILLASLLGLFFRKRRSCS